MYFVSNDENKAVQSIISHFIMDVITNPCWDKSYSMLVKGGPGGDIWRRLSDW